MKFKRTVTSNIISYTAPGIRVKIDTSTDALTFQDLKSGSEVTMTRKDLNEIMESENKIQLVKPKKTQSKKAQNKVKEEENAKESTDNRSEE